MESSRFKFRPLACISRKVLAVDRNLRAVNGDARFFGCLTESLVKVTRSDDLVQRSDK